MKRLPLLMLCFCLMLCTTASASSFYVSTDRVSYTGTLTEYNSLEDAQNEENVVATYSIPNRNTTSPYNTPYRDVSFYFVNDMSSYDSNYNIFMTSWFYTTNSETAPYSGSGNPNNTNVGFIQIYDEDGNTDTSTNGFFENFDGTYYTTFTLQVAGTNATYPSAEDPQDWARLWDGGTGAPGHGCVFHSYNLDVSFNGLEGQWQEGVLKATNHPTSVEGSFDAIFENSLNGSFYRASFTFGMDNWAFGQGSNLNGAFYDSEFGYVPIPPSVFLLGSGLLGLGLLGRRRKRR
jgi:hypothetical protein